MLVDQALLLKTKGYNKEHKVTRKCTKSYTRAYVSERLYDFCFPKTRKER